MNEGAVRTVPGEGVRLSEAEHEVALAETRAVLDAAVSPEARTQLSALELAIETGVLDDDDADRSSASSSWPCRPVASGPSTALPENRQHCGSTASSRGEQH